MQTRELIINCLLLAAIITLAVMILRLEPETHIVEFTPEGIKKWEESLQATDIETGFGGANGGAPAVLAAHQNFFRQDLFDPLIPTPTPTTPPPPTPTPTPSLEEAIAGRWQFQYVTGNVAAFQDTQENQFFELTVGDTRTIVWGRYTMEIRLMSVNTEAFEATVGFGDQRYTFKFF